MKIGIIVILIACSVAACSKESADVDINQETHIVAELSGSLGDRRSWPSTSVKVWLANPTVVVTYQPLTGNSITIHAWPKNQNDCAVSMIRINSGDTLYHVSEKEFVALQQLNEKA